MNIDILRTTFTYDPSTGIFYREGCECGGMTGNGYRYLTLKRKRVLAHRAAFAIVLGRWPENEVDYINGLRADNRWANLREASHRENIRNRKRNMNNRSGFKGVSLHRETGKWRARIKIDGVYASLGLHDSAAAAHKAYCIAAMKHYGAFAREG
jgi:hypothetical protein